MTARSELDRETERRLRALEDWRLRFGPWLIVSAGLGTLVGEVLRPVLTTLLR